MGRLRSWRLLGESVKLPFNAQHTIVMNKSYGIYKLRDKSGSESDCDMNEIYRYLAPITAPLSRSIQQHRPNMADRLGRV